MDIGANRGVYTLALAKKFERVFAFEPSPELVRKIRALNLSNVTVLEAAASISNGSSTFYLDRREGLDGIGSSLAKLKDIDATEIRVRTVSIDDFCAENKCSPSFIKVDVEGHEYSVLMGARQTIEKLKPVLVFEFWETWWELGKFDILFEWLSPLYNLTVLQTGESAISVYAGKNRRCRLDGVVDILCTPRPLYSRLLHSILMICNDKRKHFQR